jgi:hypothetical protein
VESDRGAEASSRKFLELSGASLEIAGGLTSTGSAINACRTQRGMRGSKWTLRL